VIIGPDQAQEWRQKPIESLEIVMTIDETLLVSVPPGFALSRNEHGIDLGRLQ
jgi:hypothetical protein